MRTVVLTHPHEDHVGGLRDLTRAKVVVSQAEGDARHMRMFGFIPMFYAPSYGFVESWERVGFDSGAFHTFDRSQDLHLLVTHDHTDYQWKHLVPFLSRGGLTEAERGAMARYEASVLDGDGTLRPGAMPAFQPDPAGGPVGTVSEPRTGP